MGFLSAFTGSEASKGAKRAANIQARAAKEAQERLIELNQPFIDLGVGALPTFQNQFVSDPTGFTYLQNNPLFNAAVDNANRATMNLGAAGGRANSGGVVDQLFKNYLAIGDDFVTSGFNRALAPVRLGQNAASLTGSRQSELITGAGNALAAGQVGAANARQQGTSNALAAAGILASFFSDQRMKENLVKVGVKDGLPLYEFNYIGQETRYRGYMAQDVEKFDPDHVLERDGYLMVTAKYAPERV